MSSPAVLSVGRSCAALTALLIGGCNPFSSAEPAHSDLAVRTQARAASAVVAPSCTPAAPKASHDADASASQPANAQPRKKSPAAAAQPTDLKVKRLVLARGVDAREPVEADTSFELGEAKRIYAFVEVANPDAVESEIFVTFEPEQGPPVGHVTLRVGPAARWRTWAFTRGAKTAGRWTAVVRDMDGELLARTPFEITS